MEEKKLTDEEILKDIERSTGMPSYWKKIVLDLIHRLQSENERLTEAMSDFRQEVITLNIEKLELQKQVDELKKESARLDKNVKWFQEKIENGELVSEKAVKDTAKEIFALLKSSEYVDNENTLSVWAIEKIIKERYGVEDELLYTQEDIDEWIRTCEELQEKNRELEQDLAEITQKIEQGTLIELPCKVGDTVWTINCWQEYGKQELGERYIVTRYELHENKCSCIEINDKNHYCGVISIRAKERYKGVTPYVFLTREEAEKRLKELQE